MFAKFAEKLSGFKNRLAGKTDLLEGIAAASALVAAADGKIDDSEVDSVLKALSNHKVLSEAFPTSTIERVADTMISRANQGRAGALGLYREIEEVNAKSGVDDREMLLVIAIDVSEADGEIDAKEREVLAKIATKLGLNINSYL